MSCNATVLRLYSLGGTHMHPIKYTVPTLHLLHSPNASRSVPEVVFADKAGAKTRWVLLAGGARAEFATHNCPVAWYGTCVGVGGHVRKPVQSGSEGCILPTRAYVRAQPQVDHYGGAVRRGKQAHHGVERRPHGHDCPQSCSGDSNYSPLTSYR